LTCAQTCSSVANEAVPPALHFLCLRRAVAACGLARASCSHGAHLHQGACAAGASWTLKPSLSSQPRCAAVLAAVQQARDAYPHGACPSASSPRRGERRALGARKFGQLPPLQSPAAPGRLLPQRRADAGRRNRWPSARAALRPRSVELRGSPKNGRLTRYRLLPALQVGLDAAGKTTILYKLKLGEIVTTIPTIGASTADLLSRPTAGAAPPPRLTRAPPVLPPRLQRGDCGVQEHLLHSVGRGRSGQGALPEHKSLWSGLRSAGAKRQQPRAALRTLLRARTAALRGRVPGVGVVHPRSM